MKKVNRQRERYSRKEEKLKIFQSEFKINSED